MHTLQSRINGGSSQVGLLISGTVGGRDKRKGEGLHLYLILQVPFSRANEIFVVVKRTSSHPLCLPLLQFYFQIIMPFFTILYYLQWLFLENNIRKFLVIDDAQRLNTVYTFQLKFWFIFRVFSEKVKN